jgi:hypothetical protein
MGVEEGTISCIVNNYKVGLDQADFECARKLAKEAKKCQVMKSAAPVKIEVNLYVSNVNVVIPVTS